MLARDHALWYCTNIMYVVFYYTLIYTGLVISTDHSPMSIFVFTIRCCVVVILVIEKELHIDKK